VVKVGGGLVTVPGALEPVCSTIAAAARQRPMLVVPGGGPFADLVRALDRKMKLSAEAAHWMAILGMDQYAHLLADLMTGAVLVDGPGEIGGHLSAAGLAVLAPSRWMRSADVLPHSWNVTSDSIAAFVAGAVGATRLILIKPVAAPAEPLDPCFAATVPVDLPYDVVGCECLEELAARLRT
jgi:5-(aminomethyl)-3-furanmethanol phosphate kinase